MESSLTPVARPVAYLPAVATSSSVVRTQGSSGTVVADGAVGEKDSATSEQIFWWTASSFIASTTL